METLLLNMGLAFIEGFALIISPCILPILPIILSASLTGSRKRPFGTIVGFVLTFAVFTLFSRKLVEYTGLDLTLVRHVSYGLLILLGLIMMSTYLTEKLNQAAQRLTNFGSSFKTANDPDGGFGSGILFGALVGVIWTPCAGPILAAVIVQSVIQQTTSASLLTVVSFGIGAAVPMLLIALFGRKIMDRFSFFRERSSFLRKLLGGIIVLAVFYMIFSEGAVGSPSFTPTNDQQNRIVNGVISPYPAPDFVGISDWINSPPLHLSDLKNKVVLVDFWTYSCINCIRTLPYLKSWYQKYHDKGFVIVGIHSPEFAFEHELNNVKNAVKNDGILYPVGLDNQFATWQSYHNQYWPAHYLIDQKGYVVYQHFGEGEYAVTENNIRYLLGLSKASMASEGEGPNHAYNQTPETYLGYERAARFMGPQAMLHDQTANYTFPAELADDQWALQGPWFISAEKITSGAKGAALKMHFNASKVYLVLGNSTKRPIKATFLLNGEALISHHGKDIVNGEVIVNKNTLYEIVALPQSANGVLQVIAEAPGLEVYTFTFGGQGQ